MTQNGPIDNVPTGEVLTEQAIRLFNADYLSGSPEYEGTIVACDHIRRKESGRLRLGTAKQIIIGNHRIVALCPGCYARIAENILTDILKDAAKEILRNQEGWQALFTTGEAERKS